MGKLKEFLATVVPVTDVSGRELFPTSAAERRSIKAGAIVSSDARRKK